MELTVHGKQIDVGDALRTHVEEKITDLNQKYFNHSVFITVTFSKEGHGHPQIKCHISFKLGKNIMIVADATTGDPYASFDSAAEKAGKQLRRYKKKLRDHHERLEQTPESEIMKARDYVLAAMPDQIANDDEDDGMPEGDDPVIVAEMATDIQTMSVSEAVMRMDLADQPALLFRNASHDGLNVVFRRPDGNVGWIDPENIEKIHKAKSA